MEKRFPKNFQQFLPQAQQKTVSPEKPIIGKLSHLTTFSSVGPENPLETSRTAHYLSLFPLPRRHSTKRISKLNSIFAGGRLLVIMS